MADEITPSATLWCNCRSVSLEIALPPVSRLQCCCCDCRKGISWCTAQGGPSSKTSAPFADLVYFPNALRVGPSAGSEKLLKCYTLQEGFPTKRIVASCCYTALVGDCAAYRGIKFVSYPDSCDLDLLDAARRNDPPKLMPPQKRIFESDLTEEERGRLPPFEEPVLDDAQSSSSSLFGLMEATEKRLKALADVPGGDTFETVQSLLSRMTVEVADPQHNGPTPMLLKMQLGEEGQSK